MFRSALAGWRSERSPVLSELVFGILMALGWNPAFNLGWLGGFEGFVLLFECLIPHQCGQ